MLIAGIIFMSLSLVVTGGATYLEWRMREPLWALMMKVGPCLFGIGGILFGLAMVR